MNGALGVWILCGILLLVIIFLGFYYVFRKKQTEQWKKQSRGELITKPKGNSPTKFQGIRATFSHGSLHLPSAKRTSLVEDPVGVTTPPALKEARRQMTEDVETQQNEINDIKVDISSVAYSKYKQLVYEENGFVNISLDDRDDESGCVTATPSTPGSVASGNGSHAHQSQQKTRKHSETEI